MTTPKTALPWREMSADAKDEAVGKLVLGWTQGKVAHMRGNYEWSPTMNIKDAHAVFEEMRRNGWLMMVENDITGQWRVAFRRSDDPVGKLASASADTFAECVSIAAIRAVGIEVAV